MFVVYILKSLSFDKIYIGYTSNLIQRFYSHNQFATKGYTTRYRPWEVIHVGVFHSKQEALKREKFLKSGAVRKWIYSKLVNQ